MLTLLLVLLFLGRRAAFAAPFQNLTDTQLTSNWESGPSGRGITDILYNSACTLVYVYGTLSISTFQQCGKTNGSLIDVK
jgi:hypothetical protein